MTETLTITELLSSRDNFNSAIDLAAEGSEVHIVINGRGNQPIAKIIPDGGERTKTAQWNVDDQSLNHQLAFKMAVDNSDVIGFRTAQDKRDVLIIPRNIF
ncbi:MAG: hypothetical protein AAF244_02140 [Pseudomonadota bacterium]